MQNRGMTLTELPAFVLPWTSKLTGHYQTGDANRVCNAFLTLLLGAKGIPFKIGQQKILTLLLLNGTSQEKHFDFHKTLTP